jgi:thioredoxin 1
MLRRQFFSFPAAVLFASLFAMCAFGGDARPKLMDLGADKCIPCKKMAPILKQMKKDYAGVLDVEFIDVWKDPDAGRKHKIEMIPTQIFFDPQGRELFRHVGFFSREDMLAKWKELGYEFTPAAKPAADAEDGEAKASTEAETETGDGKQE